MFSLSIKDLGLAYGDIEVLRDITMADIRPGSLVGILGPNGAGKSTFLKSLAGINAYLGHALLNGEDLQTMHALRRTGQVGYLPQSLPQGTTLVAYEAVISACRAVRPDLKTDVVQTMVEDVFDLLNIRHLAFTALNKMSGGQKQMVGLAQIIVRRPGLLLLDEPTSALDLRWQMAVFDVVRFVLKQTNGICLMAIHDLNLALRHCDQIALFADRQLLAFGSAKNAMTSENLRRAYRVEGRVEACSNGTPFIVTDGLIPFEVQERV